MSIKALAQPFLLSKILLSNMLVCLSLPLFSAEIQVIESQATHDSRHVSPPLSVVTASSSSPEWSVATKQLFVELQNLREEVIRLNGVIEEQQLQLTELKQRQLDNYIDVDKRIAALTSTSSLSSNQIVPATASLTDKEKKVEKDPAFENDKQAYDAAYALISNKQFSQAEAAFTAFVANYPSSQYMPNAWFWLGGLHGLSQEYVKAEIAYSTVLTDFPDHHKVPDTMYKMGDMYYQMGQADRSKKQMQQLLERYAEQPGFDKIVRRARDFLRKHFP